MINRRIQAGLLLAASAAAVALAPTAHADQNGPYGIKPAEVRYESTTQGTVTAHIKNPNPTVGYCWAIDADSGVVFGGRKLESFAAPGGSVSVSLQGLPQGPMRAQVRCGADYIEGKELPSFTSWTDPVTVQVMGPKPATGSFG